MGQRNVSGPRNDDLLTATWSLVSEWDKFSDWDASFQAGDTSGEDWNISKIAIGVVRSGWLIVGVARRQVGWRICACAKKLWSGLNGRKLFCGGGLVAICRYAHYARWRIIGLGSASLRSACIWMANGGVASRAGSALGPNVVRCAIVYNYLK